MNASEPVRLGEVFDILLGLRLRRPRGVLQPAGGRSACGGGWPGAVRAGVAVRALGSCCGPARSLRPWATLACWSRSRRPRPVLRGEIALELAVEPGRRVAACGLDGGGGGRAHAPRTRWTRPPSARPCASGGPPWPRRSRSTCIVALSDATLVGMVEAAQSDRLQLSRRQAGWAPELHRAGDAMLEVLGSWGPRSGAEVADRCQLAVTEEIRVAGWRPPPGRPARWGSRLPASAG
ncbi:hypothetical protein QJS66_14150 [Kocuria rhizophila]|nr:hypothetical protein QJS66_14150 [Kocuria rhizophila]